jgi:hypothetical protein
MIRSKAGSSSRRPRTDERGIALALALFAMVIIGALAGSTLFAGRLEQQSGQNAVFAAQVRESAELGLSEATSSMTAGSLAALSVGHGPMNLDTIMLGNGVSVSREVSRLTSSMFLVRARAIRRSTGGRVLASRSLGLMVRLPPVSAPSDTLPEGSGAGPQWVERGWVQLY